MRILIVGLMGLAIIWLVFRFLGSNFCGRRRSRADFANGIRSLLLMMENGGVLKIRHRGSSVEFEFVRTKGSDDAAELELVIPRRTWSVQAFSKLQKLLDEEALDSSIDHDAGSKDLARARFVVPNIWDEAASASPARVARLVVDALSIPADAEFDLRLFGTRSNRISERHVRGSERSR
jgi:hypothetical protein